MDRTEFFPHVLNNLNPYSPICIQLLFALILFYFSSCPYIHRCALQWYLLNHCGNCPHQESTHCCMFFHLTHKQGHNLRGTWYCIEHLKSASLSRSPYLPRENLLKGYSRSCRNELPDDNCLHFPEWAIPIFSDGFTQASIFNSQSFP